MLSPLRAPGTWAKSSLILAFLAMPALHAQTLDPLPGSITDISGQITVPGNFLFEQQIQAGTQGVDNNNNPFAFWHAVQIRSWLHYDRIRDTTLTGGLSYIDNFKIPGTSNYEHPEWRVTALGTLKQSFDSNSIYEQMRFELLNFRDSHGVTQHLPRLRFRFGQNYYLGNGRSKPYIGVYEEAVLQFPQASYSSVHFQGLRFFAGYGFKWGPRTEFIMGFKAGEEVSTSGKTATVYLGPAFSIEYKFRRDTNEKHSRTTAFKDF